MWELCSAIAGVDLDVGALEYDRGCRPAAWELSSTFSNVDPLELLEHANMAAGTAGTCSYGCWNCWNLLAVRFHM